MHYINAIEFPNFVYNDAPLTSSVLRQVEALAPPLLGQYAIAWEFEGALFLARDPLGCNKLFYGRNNENQWVVASRIYRATELGVHINQLGSCPPGHVMRLTEEGQATVIGGTDISSSSADPEWNLETLKLQIKERLQSSLKKLAESNQDARFVVCLSGGLDSSVVAALACQCLPRVHAATFTYLSTEDTKAYYTGQSLQGMESVSDDFFHASNVADALHIPLLPVIRHRNAVAAAIGEAVRLCQDWRDFNVHCAVINLFLAQDIRAAFPGQKVIVLTGDLMNEFVCDYHEEVVDGEVYYPQPRVSLTRRRRFFVRGLDAGDREVGVFNAYGLPVVQLFATVADLYMKIPGEFLAQTDAKVEINGSMMSTKVFSEVSKAKQRAQVGGEDMGTLGIFHEMGLNQQALARLWAASLPEKMASDGPHDIIQIGRYRFGPKKNH